MDVINGWDISDVDVDGDDEGNGGRDEFSPLVPCNAYK